MAKKEATDKQKRYHINKRAGLTKKEAALEAGYSLTTAENAKHMIEDTIGYAIEKDKFVKAMRDAGISDKLLARVMKEGLKSMKYVGLAGIPVPDYPTRGVYLDRALEVLGKKVKRVDIEKKAPPSRTNTVIILPPKAKDSEEYEPPTFPDNNVLEGDKVQD